MRMTGPFLPAIRKEEKNSTKHILTLGHLCIKIVIPLYIEVFFYDFIIDEKNMKNENIVVLITGCSSGIGLQLAILLAGDAPTNGYIVYVTASHVTDEMQQLANECVRVRKLDVTMEEDCQKTVNYIVEVDNKIDLLSKLRFVTMEPTQGGSQKILLTVLFEQ